MQEIFADITAGYKVLFYGRGDYAGPQGNTAGAQLAYQNGRGRCVGFFDFLYQRMVIDGQREKLTGFVQVGFIGDLDIQKIGIDGGFVKITVVDDTQIHFRVGDDHTAVILNILDNGVSQIDRPDVTGDIHTVNVDLYAITDIKRFEKGKDKTVNDVG